MPLNVTGIHTTVLLKYLLILDVGERRRTSGGWHRQAVDLIVPEPECLSVTSSVLPFFDNQEQPVPLNHSSSSSCPGIHFMMFLFRQYSVVAPSQ